MSVLAPPPPVHFGEEHIRERLERTWRHPRGLLGWFSFTTHQAIGLRYIVTAFLFLLAGGVEALLMRLQLAFPNNGVLTADKYNQIFTTHGTTMMFLFAVPMMEGLGVYLVPLMLGTRNVAFPRLNAFGYWMYLFGGLFLYVGLFTNTGPDMGWFAYPPLSGPEFSPGKRVDVWAQMITFTEVSALCVATELVATIMKLRAPGMTLNRLPLFVWSMLVQSFMVIFAMPAVMVASTLMLLMDRTVGTHFVNPAQGGDPLMYQHVFWFFGHPEVYIIFIPALGFVSSIVETHARRKIFGYPAMVMSLVATGFIGFGLWVHHMFATGLPQVGMAYFTAASMVIAIASGVQIFNWITTLALGRPRFTTSMYFVLGFIFTFVIGGLSGVMLAAIPIDWQVHDTMFVVAHFHYVLIGGAVFPLMGAFYHWYPKITGRMLKEGLGKLNFWLIFIGFQLTFFPLHALGLRGMTRRIYTYPPEMGWANLNLTATVGAVIIALGGVVFIVNAISSRTGGTMAGDDPWGGSTLEWAASSPPDNYNFVYLPAVNSRTPMWEPPDERTVVTGVRDDRREALVTTFMDAEPRHRYVYPPATIWPFLTALAVSVGYIGSVFHFSWYFPGSVLAAICLVGWFWPREPMRLAE